MQCTNCNNEIDNNSKFCKYCGAKIEEKIIKAKLRVIDKTTHEVLDERVIEIPESQLQSQFKGKINMYNELSQGILEYQNVHELKIRTSKNLTELHKVIMSWLEITEKYIKSYSKYNGKDYIDSMGMYFSIESQLYNSVEIIFSRIKQSIGNDEELKDLFEQEKNKRMEESKVELEKQDKFLSAVSYILKELVDCKTLNDYKLIEQEWVVIKKAYLKNINTTLELGYLESIYTYLEAIKHVSDVEKNMLLKVNKLLEKEIANFFKK